MSVCIFSTIEGDTFSTKCATVPVMSMECKKTIICKFHICNSC